MGKREARALAAGDFVEVRGKRFTLHPVSVRQLAELEASALRHYKHQYFESLKASSKVLGNGAQEWLERKVEEAVRWDADDLPYKEAYDVSSIPVTQKLRDCMESHYGDIPGSDTAVRAVVNMALESRLITTADVKQMTGKAPRMGRIRYDQWWVASCTEGMLEFVLTSLQSTHPDITLEEVGKWPLSSVAEAARVAEHLTTADLGNG